MPITIAAAVDPIHRDAIAEAVKVIQNFVERLEMPPKEITAWARRISKILATSFSAPFIRRDTRASTSKLSSNIKRCSNSASTAHFVM
ncbi:hypothetical protein [Bradyrhizobium diazoefficiens]